MSYGTNVIDASVGVALTEELNKRIRAHLDKGPVQEDLTFAYWRPSYGTQRMSALIDEIVLPREHDRVLDGNAAFTSDYLLRTLREAPSGHGIAFMHSHLGPGWQSMSLDDEVAEGERLAAPVFARTRLPLVGMTLGTDGAWSGRMWKQDSTAYAPRWTEKVRVVGAEFVPWPHPQVSGGLATEASQVATMNVWGRDGQARIANTRVGIVGLGSVGSIVAETLARVGVKRLTLIDHDRIEIANLDRTLGTLASDVGQMKVDIAARNAYGSATSSSFECLAVPASVLDRQGSGAALDCDVLVSCVDRPWPRYLMNVSAYGHLIPVVDGGILARISPAGEPLHVDWRIHMAGPGRACLYCLGALRRSDVALDIDGKLDDPDYVQGLPYHERAGLARRNMIAFSMSVAAHMTIQFAGCVSGWPQIGGAFPQMYHSYPGSMEALKVTSCEMDCEISALTALAPSLPLNPRPNGLERV